jgi:hypothetical protein
MGELTAVLALCPAWLFDVKQAGASFAIFHGDPTIYRDHGHVPALVPDFAFVRAHPHCLAV